jgi:tRNA(Ile)-lysidine synthase
LSPFARRIAAAIRRRRLLARDDRVAVAISGGADSVALTLAIAELAAEDRCRVAGLVHVHHGLRGDDADADAAFCDALAARLGWPIEIARVDVRARARRDRVSIEVAAREARYEQFEAARARLDATVVATAHTADDQAETVIMRLLRGAGPRGLGGIPPRRGPFVRPLLDVRRADVRRYLASRREPFREDASNADVTIARNRIRHELMPMLEHIAPAAVRALSRTADLLRDDEELLSTLAADLATMGAHASTASVSAADLKGLPPALGRRVIRAAAARASRSMLSSRHVEAIRGLAVSDKPKGHLDLPGLVVDRQQGMLTFRPAFATVAAPVAASARLPPRSRKRVAQFTHSLEVPGRVRLTETGDELIASTRSVALDVELTALGAGRAILQAGSAVPPFTVRNRRPGDRMRPLGAPGRRKVQDLMVDRKIPRETRDSVPIVVDATGRIVWVAGVAVADECRVTAPEAGVLLLELKK